MAASSAGRILCCLLPDHVELELLIDGLRALGRQYTR
jgi:hypothetical protein